MKATVETVQSRHREAKDNLKNWLRLLVYQNVIDVKTNDMFKGQIDNIEDNPYDLLADAIDKSFEVTRGGKRYTATYVQAEIKE